MRWQGNRQSENVEDRRGEGPMTGGGGIRFGGGRGIGIGTIVIALVGGWLLGINPLHFLVPEIEMRLQAGLIVQQTIGRHFGAALLPRP